MAVIEQLFSVSLNSIYSLSGKEMLAVFATHSYLSTVLLKIPGCDPKSVSRMILGHTSHNCF
jgi:hypothetical protein